VRLCPSCGAVLDGEEWECPQCNVAFASNGRYVDLVSVELERQYFGQIAESAEEFARLEQDCAWFEQRARLVSETIAGAFPTAKSLLEVGCGTGYVLQQISSSLPWLTISGGDLNGASLIEARRRVPSASLFRMRGEAIPFLEEFDVVCCLDVLEHVHDDRAVLQSIHRATRPSGGLIVTVPQHPWMWSEHDERAEHFRRYTRSQILRKVSISGFRIISTTSFVSLLLPALAIMRMLGGRTRAERCVGELAPSWTVNRFLQVTMGLERRLIRLGVRFPFGSSRLIVAARAP